MQIQSIAFPLLGTGAGGFPPDECLDTMFRFAASMLAHGRTCLRSVKICLFAARKLLSYPAERLAPRVVLENTAVRSVLTVLLEKRKLLHLIGAVGEAGIHYGGCPAAVLVASLLVVQRISSAPGAGA